MSLSVVEKIHHKVENLPKQNNTDPTRAMTPTPTDPVEVVASASAGASEPSGPKAQDEVIYGPKFKVRHTNIH